MSNLDQIVNDLVALIVFIRNNFSRPADQITRLRLSPGHFRVLSSVYHGGSLPMSELAAEMGMSKQQLTPLVDRLIKDGLVTRNDDEHDRRIKRVEMTEEGRQTFRELGAELRQSFGERLKVIPEDQLEELGRMLPRVHEILKGAKGIK
ncbi:MAG: MarR family winged helix-turn-helix transcriptional regulator [Bacillota bacterium]